jgi:hypothetical protein
MGSKYVTGARPSTVTRVEWVSPAVIRIGGPWEDVHL